MEKTLTLLVGISGSGKSTYAKERVINSNFKVTTVSRDNIRKTLFGLSDESFSNYYKGNKFHSLEKYVTDVQINLIKMGLAKFNEVIVDNTNLKFKYLKYLIDKFKYDCDIVIEVFPCYLEECIERDSKRNRVVGKEIIMSQYNQFLNFPYEKLEEIGFIKTGDTGYYLPQIKRELSTGGNVIVVDIDGTVAIKCDRHIHDLSKVKGDFKKDFVIDVIKALSNKFEIVFCSGRQEFSRAETEEWLKSTGIPFQKLFMRATGDYRPDYIVKPELWKLIEEEFGKIHSMFDDRNCVVKTARDLGYNVFDVAEHYF